MVWGQYVPNLNKLSLVYVQNIHKIMTEHYKTEILEKVLHPSIEQVFRKECYCHQKDGTPGMTFDISGKKTSFNMGCIRH